MATVFAAFVAYFFWIVIIPMAIAFFQAPMLGLVLTSIIWLPALMPERKR